MNQDQNCPIFRKMQHQLQETQPAGTSRTEHSQAFANNRPAAVREQASCRCARTSVLPLCANRSVNLATSAADRQPDDDRGVCYTSGEMRVKQCNAPLVKAAAITPVVSVVSAIELFLLFLLLNTTGYSTSALCRLQYFAVMSNTF